NTTSIIFQTSTVACCNGAPTTTLGLSKGCFDPLDPNGNVTITYDIRTWTTHGYVGRVTVQNYYQFRHVEKPGWKLGWTWTRGEVIWSMSGAFATEQGNCSLFKFDTPHSCEGSPVILDLMPEASPENRSEGCCRGGVLSAWAVDPSKSFTSFEISVGSMDEDGHEQPPANVTLMAPGLGYTCSPFLDAHPTVSSVIDGKRQVQVFRTWKSTCTYSMFVANKTPLCCVSLSTFYNPSITPCPTCSCGCRKADKSSVQCTRYLLSRF
ncbi:COBRA-like protein 2, partial [Cucurbita pepo subsp. pepo]|uniref:COBRA-like protein 2 n=1 Tax=Cucurbita pepo subsp. pepo TaxID=3664 RepID=UPI000C9D4BBE